MPRTPAKEKIPQPHRCSLHELFTAHVLEKHDFNKIKFDFNIIIAILASEFNFIKEMPFSKNHPWLDFLEDEDLAFIKRFILFSGSLKDLATAYSVSYPTLRLRLDRLIAKITVLDNQKIEDDHERLLRALYAEGKLDAASFKQLLSTYNQHKKVSQ